MEQSACISGPMSDMTVRRPVVIDDLPTEMLWEVFSYLDMNDLVSACCVSSRWKDVGNGVPLMTQHVYNITSDQSPSEIDRTLHSIPNIRTIKICRSCRDNVEYTLMTLYKVCTDIRVIDIYMRLQIDSKLVHDVVKKFPNLVTLKVPLWSHPQQVINQIGACLELKELALFTSNFDIDLKQIADGCPNLRHLDIRECRYRTDVFIYLLGRKKHLLQSLLFNPTSFSPNTASALSECTCLEHVGCRYISSMKIGEILDGTSSLSGLNRLDLGFCGNVTQDDAMLLSKSCFPSTLSALYLEFVTDVPQHFSRTLVSSLPNVELLRVTVLCFKNEGLQYLLEMKKLKHLEIVGWCLGESSFQMILQCKQINHLFLYRCIGLNDNEVLRLVKEMNLRYLKIARCASLTDEFLKSFPGCETMKELDVDVQDPLDQTVKELKIRQPSTQITVRNYNNAM